MDATTYQWPDHAQTPAHAYLLPAVLAAARESGERRLFDLGCGNGSVANRLSQEGWDVTGVDMSGQGIAQANRAFPHLKLHLGSAYDDLASKYGQFPVVLSLEVVEHLYDPRAYARTLFDLTAPGGMAIISTPYHGYWKNLALALTGKMDQHFTALWDNGHIKFWSGRTLSMLIAQPGFIVEKIVRVGRIPALAKSMVLIARRPF